MLGLSKQETQRLKSLQYEYNIRNSKILEQMEKSNNMKDNIPKQKPKGEGRHEEFQRGHNPMKMSSFESELVKKEEQERADARIKYVQGLQGRDGGPFPCDEQIKPGLL